MGYGINNITHFKYI